jgi:hypothetical protein
MGGCEEVGCAGGLGMVVCECIEVVSWRWFG